MQQVAHVVTFYASTSLAENKPYTHTRYVHRFNLYAKAAGFGWLVGCIFGKVKIVLSTIKTPS